MAKRQGFGSEMGVGFRRPPYRYELVNYAWVNTTRLPHWNTPASAVGLVDLRTLAQQSASGGTPAGFAFVACLQSPGGTALATGPHMSGLDSTTAMRDAWQGATGYRPAGAKLTDLLWDQLTNGADPAGEAGPKPLVPTTGGQLELWLGGHSLVRREAFRWGVHPHTNRVRDVIRRDFERLWEATGGHDHCRRVLDYQAKKLRADWRDLIPARLRPHVAGPLPHQTTITDDFTRADGDTIGNLLTWTELENDFDTVSNRASLTTTGADSFARADSNLSSDDHYSQITARGNSTAGASAIYPTCRNATGATRTWYMVDNSIGGDASTLYKRVTGTFTAIGSGIAHTFANDTDYLIEVEANGSTITSRIDNVDIDTVTDSAITGNLMCGFGGYRTGGTTSYDGFEAADLAAGGTAVPVFRRHYQLMQTR